MKTNISKKEVRHNLETALIVEIEKMGGSESSKKVRKVVKKISKNIAGKVRVDINKKLRKASKRQKSETTKDLNGFLIENGVEKIEIGHE